MRKTTSRRGWLAIGTGVALGMTGAIVAGQITGQASAQASKVTLSVEQLLINQRISQAAVRRSNESLNLLDPIRAAPKQPNKVLGWRTQDLRDSVITSTKLVDKAVTTAKIADNAITPAQLSEDLREAQPRWARVAPDGALKEKRGVTAAATSAAGEYTVTFDRSVAACAVQATVSSDGTTAPPAGHTISTWLSSGDPKIVHVRAVASDGTTGANTPFHISALC